MNVRFTIFRRIGRHGETWTLVGAPGVSLQREGRHAGKLEEQVREALRKLVESTPASDAAKLMPALSATIEHARLELTLGGELGRRTVTGRVPLIVERRRAGEDAVLTVVYHPERKDDWFELAPTGELGEQATRFFQHALRDVPLDDLTPLFRDERARLHTITVSQRPKAPKLPKRAESTPLLGRTERERVLSQIALDRTRQVAAMSPEEHGVARSPYREQLAALLGGVKKRSTIVVGESGVGKSALITQLVHDLLLAEDYPVHRNLDRVRHVYQLSARQLIAGMSYVGQWEQRCLDLLEEVKERRALLLVTDLAAFGRTGRSQKSDRTLADVFRGPVARGELVLIGELSPSELARLEQDAPAFASLFASVRLPPTSKAETLAIVQSLVRRLEAEERLSIRPDAVLRLLELTASLTTTRKLPGAAMDVLRKLASPAERQGRPIDARTVLHHVASALGLPGALLDPQIPLDHAAVCASLSERVLGQPRAVARAADVVVRVKAGLVDPRRPYAALLLAGPTGTGKTELAKALAAELYGDLRRLVRFDMGEYTGGDALARLLGDDYEPEGALTRALAQQPSCVLLLDEIEKAHPSVFPLLLQLLDEGRLTSAEGRTVSFRQAVVILTSNLGARGAPPVGFGEPEGAATRDALRAVEQFFAPELFNRIDAVLPFSPLALVDAARIVERELLALCARPGLRDRHVFVIAEPEAIANMAAEGARADEGARALRRFLEDRVGSVLAEIAAETHESALRIVHVRAADSGFSLVQHALEGAPPLDASFALAPLLGRSASEVRAALPGMLARLHELAASPELPRIAAHVSRALEHRRHGAELFTLDALRAELSAMQDELRLLIETDHTALREAWERDFVLQPAREGGAKVAHVRTRSELTTQPTRSRLSALIARACFLRRSVARALEPGVHLVDVELVALTPLARRRQAQLMRWLLEAYAGAHGELSEFALCSADAIQDGGSDGELRAALHTLSPSCAVLRISGLCALDFFGPEAGIHILQPRSREPELVRVQVRTSEPGTSARARVATLAAEQRAAKDPSLFVAPVARVVRFEPARDETPTLLELEDYPHAYVAEQRVTALSQALAPLFLIRMSREEP